MRKRLLEIISITVLFLSLTVNHAFAELYINEFSSSSSSDDWIEIYNNGSDSVDLAEYRIRDDTASNKLDLDGMLGAQEFKTFSWSNKLNNSGDIIKLVLTNNESNIRDQVAYGDKGTDIAAPLGEQSAGRQANGNSPWVIFTTSSKDVSNANSSPAPTSTPILSPTPTPTKVPTPPKTPTPTKTPTKSAGSGSTNIATTVSIPTNKPSSSNSKAPAAKSVDLSRVPTSILGVGTKSADKKASKSANQKLLVGSATQNNFRYVALGIGVISLAYAILIFIKARNANKK